MTNNNTTNKVYIPVREFGWEVGKEGPMFELTCKHHPTAKYLTKNPHTRSLHFIAPCKEWSENPDIFGGKMECPCPFGDLVVVMEKDTDEYESYLIRVAEREERD